MSKSMQSVIALTTILILAHTATSAAFAVASKITFNTKELEKNAEARQARLAVVERCIDALNQTVFGEIANSKDDVLNDVTFSQIKEMSNSVKGGELNVQTIHSDCPVLPAPGFRRQSRLREMVDKLINGDGFRKTKGSAVQEYKEMYAELLSDITRTAFLGESAGIESLEVSINEFSDPTIQLASNTIKKEDAERCRFFFNKEVKKERQNKLDIVLWAGQGKFAITTIGSRINPSDPLPDASFKWQKPGREQFDSEVEKGGYFSKISDDLSGRFERAELVECSFSTDGTYEHLRLRYDVPTDQQRDTSARSYLIV